MELLGGILNDLFELHALPKVSQDVGELWKCNKSLSIQTVWK
jgi:hypothetical protein